MVLASFVSHGNENSLCYPNRLPVESSSNCQLAPRIVVVRNITIIGKHHVHQCLSNPQPFLPNSLEGKWRTKLCEVAEERKDGRVTAFVVGEKNGA